MSRYNWDQPPTFWQRVREFFEDTWEIWVVGVAALALTISAVSVCQ